VRQILRRYGFPLLTLLGLGMFYTPVFGSDDGVVAVLSSHSGPYQQAFEGFQQAFGHSIPSFALSDGTPRIPSGTRVILAIGGKAALYSYPSGPLLVYCLAPGTKVKAEGHSGGLLKIHTNPSVFLTVSKFKELQPSLTRLAVVWAGDSIQDYIDQTKDIAERLGVDMVSDRVLNPNDLPDHLRALKGKVNAIWLPPDAAMVTPKNFATIKEFSLANSIPFYVPSDGLVDQGATASVYCSFGEIGALAAQMVHQALNGALNTDRAFPEKTHLAVNLTAAKVCNLKISSEVLKQADKVVP
jgi:putative ABC transport system substrate-binding protein